VHMLGYSRRSVASTDSAACPNLDGRIAFGPSWYSAE
jgi:hypothetical protein